MSKSFSVVLQNEYEDYCYDPPGASVIKELMLQPEKYNPIPCSDGIELQIVQIGDWPFDRSHPDYRSGEVELFFYHKGACILRYIGTRSGGKRVLINYRGNSMEVVEIKAPDAPFSFYGRNWVPCEEALPYVEEFCETGIIDLEEGRWEKYGIYD
jgi:hypothetical protein